MRIHRFDFGGLHDFRGPIADRATKTVEPEAAEALPLPPVFNEADIDAARMMGKKEGYNEGFSAGKLEAKKEADQRQEEVNAIILAFGKKISTINQHYKQTLVHESEQLSRLVLSIAHKIAAEAMQERGADVISAIVERCLPVIFSKPKVIIELNPELFDQTLERIETMLRQSGFEGEVQFRSNEQLGPSDIRLDWGSGQLSRDVDSMWKEIEALIERVPLELTFSETLTEEKNQ